MDFNLYVLNPSLRSHSSHFICTVCTTRRIPTSIRTRFQFGCQTQACCSLIFSFFPRAGNAVVLYVGLHERFRITGDPNGIIFFNLFFFPFFHISPLLLSILGGVQGSISLYITVTAPFSTRRPTRQHTRHRGRSNRLKKNSVTCKFSLSCRWERATVVLLLYDGKHKKKKREKNCMYSEKSINRPSWAVGREGKVLRWHTSDQRSGSCRSSTVAVAVAGCWRTETDQ